jgi:hypothetical protein
VCRCCGGCAGAAITSVLQQVEWPHGAWAGLVLPQGLVQTQCIGTHDDVCNSSAPHLQPCSCVPVIHVCQSFMCANHGPRTEIDALCCQETPSASFLQRRAGRG